MFQFAGFPLYGYVFTAQWQGSSLPGFPIQISADLRIFAPPRGFSQLVTSFFGSQCLGIRPVPFLLDLSCSCSVTSMGLSSIAFFFL